MKKKIISLLLMFITLLTLLTACQEYDSKPGLAVQLINKEQLEHFHAKRLTDIETPYTMCFENSDGTKSLYIFASPIAYYDASDILRAIDTALVSVTDSELKRTGYSLESNSSDIKGYFPQHLAQTPILIQSKDNAFSFAPTPELAGGKLQKSTFIDLIGQEHDACVYQKGENIQIEYIPTTAGIMAHITLREKPASNQLDFYINQREYMDCAIEDNQYVVFKKINEQTPKIIIYTSFLQDSAGAISFDNRVQTESKDEMWQYTITLDESFLNDPNTQYPLTISPTFELYRNKTPDATAYQIKPNANVEFADYAVLGNDDRFGSSQHYLKFRVNYVLKSYEQNVISAVYVSTTLSRNTAVMPVDMLRLKDFWSSTDLNWENKCVPYGMESATTISSQGRYSFDITNFIKACIKDDTYNTEGYGLVMTAPESSVGTKIIATNDNSFYLPYVRIDFYDLPWTFERIYEINPN